jgi:hypothetical protein
VDSINVAKDGTFTMEQFNWAYSDYDAIPNWIKANSITQYSPFSYELENKDVLGIYSAALYDYGGHLPSANGVNMRNAEMGFTSFEYLEDNATGNFIFGGTKQPIITMYDVKTGVGNLIVVDIPIAELEGVTAVDVGVRSPAKLFRKPKTTLVYNNEIVCKEAHPVNPKWSVIVVKKSPAPDTWAGKVFIRRTVTPVNEPVIDDAVAHSGKSSLKISTPTTFRQGLIKLDSGKVYRISGWVTSNSISYNPPLLASNLGIEVILRNKAGNIISSTSFSPSGKIIEGWQQIKGSFICVAKNASMEIRFISGGFAGGTIAWFDDLRVHPELGNMKSYVYDLTDYRLRAILDEENFASFFYYDKEGNLYLTKKETEEGVKTLSENISYQKENHEE